MLRPRNTLFRARISQSIVAVIFMSAITLAATTCASSAEADPGKAVLGASSPESDKDIGPASADSTIKPDKKSKKSMEGSKAKEDNRSASARKKTELGSGGGNTGGVPSGAAGSGH